MEEEVTTLKESNETLEQELTTLKESNTALDAYPVGSIYIGTSATNPGEIFGGTWEAYGAGRTLVGVGTGTDTNSTSKAFTAGSTGGEYTHKLTIAEMPSHNHGTFGNTSWIRIYENSYYNLWGVGSSSGTGSHTGGNGFHNNIQPYIATYMWKRVA